MNIEECNYLLCKAMENKDYAGFSKTYLIYQSEHKDESIKTAANAVIERGHTLNRPEKYFEILDEKTRGEMFGLMTKNIPTEEQFNSMADWYIQFCKDKK
jgi:hypothetical protein